LGHEPFPYPVPSIGIARDGQLIAGVTYHGFRTCPETGEPLDIQANIASTDPRWATRDVLYTLFAYPFLQLGVHRLTTLCNADNDHVTRFNRRLGFTQETILKKGWSVNHNARLWRMLKDDCRWIKECS